MGSSGGGGDEGVEEEDGRVGDTVEDGEGVGG